MLVSLQIVRYSSAVSSFHPRYSSNNQCRAAKFRINCCTRPVSVQEPPPPVTDVDAGNRKLEAGGNSGAGVQVPRRRYIAVPKSRILDSIISTMFSEGEDEACDFRALSECLDSILHAEHKSILEEMRADFDQTSSMKSDEGSLDDLASLFRKFAASSESIGSVMDDDDGELAPDWRLLLDSSLKSVTRNSTKEPRVMIPVRFQRSFMQLLRNAEFEELSPMDLMLSSALNTDYLLTLPIYVDWKKASESGAIVFRRGYATERQKGLLIAEKLDYLQSKLLQIFFLFLAKPVGNFGLWLNEVIRSIRHENDTESLANKFSLWIKELPISLRQISFNEELSDDLQEYDFFSGNHPIWVASQKAVGRYEGIFSAFGPRERLLRKFLTWTGLVPSTPQQSLDIDHNTAGPESHLRPSFLSRISLGDIWKPASAKSCGNDLRKMFGAAVSILFTQSVLQEPAFQELILIYTEDVGEKETADKAVSSLRMKIYEKIPIPDLPVVFPHKKLSFRIIDTVRLDVTTILGLLAYFLSYKFEDILSSPSAIPLDVIALTALVIYVSRVLLGYKQTRDRYQLLVNRTLYEKTIASGFGSIHFLLDASEQQLFKEAILTYAVLLKAEGSQVTSTRTIGDKCEKFLYNVFQEKIEMPFDKAIETLERLGLVTHKVVDGQFLLQAIPCERAHIILKNRWNSLIG